MVMDWYKCTLSAVSCPVSCPVSARNGGCPVPVAPLVACSSLAVSYERAIAACSCASLPSLSSIAAS